MSPPRPQAAVGVTLLGSMERVAAAAANLEAAGVDSLWTGEYFRSALVRAAVVASATSGPRVGTHVLQAFARSPLTTALAAQDLQELSGGRFVLGLGSQVPAANRRWHGICTPRPVAMLEEYVRALRRLLAAPGDERVVVEGPTWDLDIPAFRPQRSHPAPPIHVGGAGERTVRAAGAVADGLLGHLLWTGDHVRAVVRPQLARTHPGFPVTVARLVAPSVLRGSAYDAARQLAHYATTPAYQQLLADVGSPVDRRTLRSALRGRPDHLRSLAQPLIDRFCVRDAEDLRATLEDAAAAGIDSVLLTVPAVPGTRVSIDDYEESLPELVEAATHASPTPGTVRPHTRDSTSTTGEHA